MTRPYRIQIENGVYHLTSRGNKKSSIFHNKKDYETFLGYLKKAKEKYTINVYAYVLMSNHYHLLIETPQANLSSMMQYLNTSYTNYYNWKHKCSGHLFQGRYKSLLIDSEHYFARVMRYIHLNPVKAKMVEIPQGYTWSSYVYEISRGRSSLIDAEPRRVYLEMSKKEYQSFVMEGLEREDNLFENVYGSFLLGGSRFIKESLDVLKEQVQGEEYSKKKRIDHNVELEEIVAQVSSYYKESIEEILSSKRQAKVSKKVALYLCKRFTGYTNKDIGLKFGIGHSAVSKAYYDIERSQESDRQLKKALKKLISHFEG